jgi:hypothetical protein
MTPMCDPIAENAEPDVTAGVEVPVRVRSHGNVNV